MGDRVSNLTIDGVRLIKDLKVTELKSELEERGLSKYGNKRELVQRLSIFEENRQKSTGQQNQEAPNQWLENEADLNNDFLREYFKSQKALFQEQVQRKNQIGVSEPPQESLPPPPASREAPPLHPHLKDAPAKSGFETAAATSTLLTPVLSAKKSRGRKRKEILEPKCQQLTPLKIYSEDVVTPNLLSSRPSRSSAQASRALSLASFEDEEDSLDRERFDPYSFEAKPRKRGGHRSPRGSSHRRLSSSTASSETPPPFKPCPTSEDKLSESEKSHKVPSLKIKLPESVPKSSTSNISPVKENINSKIKFMQDEFSKQNVASKTITQICLSPQNAEVSSSVQEEAPSSLSNKTVHIDSHADSTSNSSSESENHVSDEQKSDNESSVKIMTVVSLKSRSSNFPPKPRLLSNNQHWVCEEKKPLPKSEGSPSSRKKVKVAKLKKEIPTEVSSLATIPRESSNIQSNVEIVEKYVNRPKFKELVESKPTRGSTRSRRKMQRGNVASVKNLDISTPQIVESPLCIETKLKKDLVNLRLRDESSSSKDTSTSPRLFVKELPSPSNLDKLSLRRSSRISKHEKKTSKDHKKVDLLKSNYTILKPLDRKSSSQTPPPPSQLLDSKPSANPDFIESLKQQIEMPLHVEKFPLSDKSEVTSTSELCDSPKENVKKKIVDPSPSSYQSFPVGTPILDARIAVAGHLGSSFTPDSRGVDSSTSDDLNINKINPPSLSPCYLKNKPSTNIDLSPKMNIRKPELRSPPKKSGYLIENLIDNLSEKAGSKCKGAVEGVLANQVITDKKKETTILSHKTVSVGSISSEPKISLKLQTKHELNQPSKSICEKTETKDVKLDSTFIESDSLKSSAINEVNKEIPSELHGVGTILKFIEPHKEEIPIALPTPKRSSSIDEMSSHSTSALKDSLSLLEKAFQNKERRVSQESQESNKSFQDILKEATLAADIMEEDDLESESFADFISQDKVIMNPYQNTLPLKKAVIPSINSNVVLKEDNFPKSEVFSEASTKLQAKESTEISDNIFNADTESESSSSTFKCKNLLKILERRKSEPIKDEYKRLNTERKASEMSNDSSNIGSQRMPFWDKNLKINKKLENESCKVSGIEIENVEKEPKILEELGLHKIIPESAKTEPVTEESKVQKTKPIPLKLQESVHEVQKVSEVKLVPDSSSLSTDILPPKIIQELPYSSIETSSDHKKISEEITTISKEGSESKYIDKFSVGMDETSTVKDNKMLPTEKVVGIGTENDDSLVIPPNLKGMETEVSKPQLIKHRRRSSLLSFDTALIKDKREASCHKVKDDEIYLNDPLLEIEKEKHLSSSSIDIIKGNETKGNRGQSEKGETCKLIFKKIHSDCDDIKSKTESDEQNIADVSLENKISNKHATLGKDTVKTEVTSELNSDEKKSTSNVQKEKSVTTTEKIISVEKILLPKSHINMPVTTKNEKLSSTIEKKFVSLNQKNFSITDETSTNTGEQLDICEKKKPSTSQNKIIVKTNEIIHVKTNKKTPVTMNISTTDEKKSVSTAEKTENINKIIETSAEKMPETTVGKINVTTDEKFITANEMKPLTTVTTGIKSSLTMEIKSLATTVEKSPATTVEKSPATTVEKSPATTVEKSPEATVEKSSEATVEKSSEATVEKSPEATVEKSPEATVEKSLKATVEKSSEATVEKSPEATVEKSSEATVEKSPEATVEKSPEATVEKSPVTTVEKSPVTTVEKSPVTTVEKSPVTTVEKSPVTTVEKSPVTTVEKSPVTTVEKSPVTTVEKSPVTTVEKSPVTTVEKSPVTTVEKSPVTTVEKSPVTTVEKSPATTVEKSPATTVEKSRVTTVEKSPATTVEKSPEATVEKSPEATVEKSPEATVEKSPEATVEKSPVTTVEKGPVTTVEKGPVTTVEKGPVTTVEKSPATTVEKSPATTVEKSPATTVEKSPATTVKKSPATTVEKSPATTVEKSPATTVEKSPATTVEKSRATTVEKRPVPTIEDSPATTVEKSSPTMEKKSPTPTTGKSLMITDKKMPVTVEEKMHVTPDGKILITTDKKSPVIIEKILVTTYEKSPVTINEKSPIAIEEKSSIATDEKSPVATAEKTPVITVKTPVSTVEKTPVSTVEKTTVITVEKNPVSTIEKTPVSTVEKTPVSTVEKTPFTTVEKTPVTTLKKTPVSTVEKSPVTTMEKSPVTTAEKTPVTIVEKSLVTIVEKSLVTIVEKSPVTTVEKTPVTIVEKSPVTIVEKSPVTILEKSPVTTVEKPPVSTAEKTPVTIVEKTPVTTVEKTPVTTVEKTPGTIVEKSPFTTVEKSPFTTVEKTPVTTVEKTPVTTAEKTPVTTVEKTPVTTLEKTPVTTMEKTPVTTMEKTPVSTVEKNPVTTVEKTSITTVEKTPVTTLEKTPVATVEKTPVSTVEKTPVSTVEKTTVTTVKKSSVTSVEKTSVAPVLKSPVTTVGKIPVTTVKRNSVITVEKSPVATLEKSPVATLEKSPVATLEKSPVATLEKSPVATLEKSPVATLEKTPVSTVEKTPVSTVEKTSVSTVEKTSITTVEKTPVTTVEKTPVATVEKTPVSTVEKSPVATLEKSPVATLEKSPVATLEKSPVATLEKTPVATLKKTPVATLEKSPVATLEKSPVATLEKSPVATLEKSPVATLEKSPVATLEKSPVSTVEKTPVSTVEKTPVSTVEKTSITTVEKTPVTTVEKTPVATVERTPVSTVEKTPVSTVEKSPVATLEKSPVATLEKSPVATLEKSPVATLEKSPVATLEKSPVATLEKSPVATLEKSPVATLEKSPVATLEKSPVATLEKSPVATLEKSPVATLEKSPVATLEKSPVATLEKSPVATLEKSPVTTDVKFSVTTFEKSPVTTNERKPVNTVEKTPVTTEMSVTIYEKNPVTIDEKSKVIIDERILGIMEKKIPIATDEKIPATNKISIINYGKIPVITKKKSSITIEENSSPNEKLVMDVKSSGATNVKSLATTDVKGSVTADQKSSVSTDQKSPVTSDQKSPVTSDQKSSVTTDQKSSVTADKTIPMTTGCNVVSVDKNPVLTDKEIMKTSNKKMPVTINVDKSIPVSVFKYISDEQENSAANILLTTSETNLLASDEKKPVTVDDTSVTLEIKPISTSTEKSASSYKEKSLMTSTSSFEIKPIAKADKSPTSVKERSEKVSDKEVQMIYDKNDPKDFSDMKSSIRTDENPFFDDQKKPTLSLDKKELTKSKERLLVATHGKEKDTNIQDKKPSTAFVEKKLISDEGKFLATDNIKPMMSDKTDKTKPMTSDELQSVNEKMLETSDTSIKLFIQKEGEAIIIQNKVDVNVTVDEKRINKADINITLEKRLDSVVTAENKTLDVKKAVDIYATTINKIDVKAKMMTENNTIRSNSSNQELSSELEKKIDFSCNKIKSTDEFEPVHKKNEMVSFNDQKINILQKNKSITLMTPAINELSATLAESKTTSKDEKRLLRASMKQNLTDEETIVKKFEACSESLGKNATCTTTKENKDKIEVIDATTKENKDKIEVIDATTKENKDKIEVIDATTKENKDKIEVIDATTKENKDKIEVIDATTKENKDKIEVIDATTKENKDKIEVIDATTKENKDKIEVIDATTKENKDKIEVIASTDIEIKKTNEIYLVPKETGNIELDKNNFLCDVIKLESSELKADEKIIRTSEKDVSSKKDLCSTDKEKVYLNIDNQDDGVDCIDIKVPQNGNKISITDNREILTKNIETIIDTARENLISNKKQSMLLSSNKADIPTQCEKESILHTSKSVAKSIDLLDKTKELSEFVKQKETSIKVSTTGESHPKDKMSYTTKMVFGTAKRKNEDSDHVKSKCQLYEFGDAAPLTSVKEYGTNLKSHNEAVVDGTVNEVQIRICTLKESSSGSGNHSLKIDSEFLSVKKRKLSVSDMPKEIISSDILKQNVENEQICSMENKVGLDNVMPESDKFNFKNNEITTDSESLSVSIGNMTTLPDKNRNTVILATKELLSTCNFNPGIDSSYSHTSTSVIDLQLHEVSKADSLKSNSDLKVSENSEDDVRVLSSKQDVTEDTSYRRDGSLSVSNIENSGTDSKIGISETWGKRFSSGKDSSRFSDNKECTFRYGYKKDLQKSSKLSLTKETDIQNPNHVYDVLTSTLDKASSSNKVIQEKGESEGVQISENVVRKHPFDFDLSEIQLPAEKKLTEKKKVTPPTLISSLKKGKITTKDIEPKFFASKSSVSIGSSGVDNSAAEKNNSSKDRPLARGKECSYAIKVAKINFPLKSKGSSVDESLSQAKINSLSMDQDKSLILEKKEQSIVSEKGKKEETIVLPTIKTKLNKKVMDTKFSSQSMAALLNLREKLSEDYGSQARSCNPIGRNKANSASNECDTFDLSSIPLPPLEPQPIKETGVSLILLSSNSDAKEENVGQVNQMARSKKSETNTEVVTQKREDSNGDVGESMNSLNEIRIPSGEKSSSPLADKDSLAPAESERMLLKSKSTPLSTESKETVERNVSPLTVKQDAEKNGTTDLDEKKPKAEEPQAEETPSAAPNPQPLQDASHETDKKKGDDKEKEERDPDNKDNKDQDRKDQHDDDAGKSKEKSEDVVKSHKSTESSKSSRDKGRSSRRRRSRSTSASPYRSRRGRSRSSSSSRSPSRRRSTKTSQRSSFKRSRSSDRRRSRDRDSRRTRPHSRDSRRGDSSRRRDSKSKESSKRSSSSKSKNEPPSKKDSKPDDATKKSSDESKKKLSKESKEESSAATVEVPLEGVKEDAPRDKSGTEEEGRIEEGENGEIMEEKKEEKEEEKREEEKLEVAASENVTPFKSARKVSLSRTKSQEDDKDKPKKKKWGASAATKPSLEISSFSLKSLMPDVKPLSPSELTLQLDSGKESEEESEEEREDKEEELPMDEDEAKEDEVKRKTKEDSDEDQEDRKKEVSLPRRRRSLSKERPRRRKEEGGGVSARGTSPHFRKRHSALSSDRSPQLTRKIRIVETGPSTSVKLLIKPARNPVSKVIQLQNLVRPFTIKQLKDLLQRTGRLVDNGFWIDSIKSKCLAMYETEDQAQETRMALHGVKWPTINPKNLYVDFSSEEELKKKMAETAYLQPQIQADEPKRDRRRVDGPVREWDLAKLGERSPGEREREKERQRREREEERIREREKLTKTHPGGKEKSSKKAAVKSLDDLFKKTKAKPSIYWLPLSTSQIAEKEAQRRKRIDETERLYAEMKLEREKQRAEREKEEEKRRQKRKEREKEREKEKSSRRSRSRSKRRSRSRSTRSPRRSPRRSRRSASRDTRKSRKSKSHSRSSSRSRS